MSKKYIPNNSCLKCDKGSAPVRLKVTHHNNTKIYGEFLASEADMVPGENILPMGRCSVTGGSCKFDPIYWDKTNKGVKVNGYKLLFEDANLLCKQGGKISVDFNAPGGMSTAGALVTGAGAGTFNYGSYTNTLDILQRGTIYDVENGKISLVRSNSESDYRRHGNYGEMKDNVYHRQEGFRDVRSEHPVIDIDKPTASGIDGAYAKDNGYKITDGKYNTASIQNTTTGRELSERWTRNHIDNNGAINPADEAGVRLANTDGSLNREVIRVKPDGSMQSETINSNGFKATRGQSEALEIKTSRAGNFMNGVRSSMLNSKPLTALSESNFSQAVRNSRIATGANDGLFKASQAIARSPALSVAGKVAGRGLIVVGIALDAVSIYSAYEEEGGFGKKTKEAVGGAAGGLAGGIAGAEIGAMIGTAICPGVGTVVGGIVGGVIGGLAGSGIGKSIAGWFS
ncbi:PAAR-like protein [Mucilaginibacter sp. P19]|uniref:DUF4280 domain-containing protein n=2 Tax=Mucilaginibacter TaxID=423349 RepID=A0AAE6MIY4_9SPHI|nr:MULTISPECIES: PAAR-like protein [Mucilaginibacter]QEM05300.1 DUF4280 domain-containing protein [Mucilaginibacter rubeus]QEM17890.1 DUF4280 domain-containing protein [Mucilaginibacter gossypii]QTE45577.1 DUF4280 domain-containing protein [Mucilaginibacter rubeus]QTE52174.1 DUF4280 domain-containing protein [Mucilaginibacter rubeus]QTE57262.1 DUF4280 domain-containing protein [Mucilaginibacter rubeus]